MWLKYSKNSVFPKLLITKNIWVSPIQEIAFFFLVCNRTHGKPVKTGHQIDEIFSLITHFVLQHISKGKENSFWFCFCNPDHLCMHCSVNVSSAYKSKSGRCTMHCATFKVLFLNLTFHPLELSL